LTSLLLHIANVVLLFVLVRLLAGDRRVQGAWRKEARVQTPAQPQAGGRKKTAKSAEGAGPDQADASHATAAAFASAAVWAVHPLMTQAVAYTSGRSELLCAFFFLIAFLCLHAWAVSARMVPLALGITAWALALASKEVAVILPLVLLADGRLLLPPKDAAARRRLTRICVPMLVFVVVAAAARLWVFTGVENVSRASFAWGNFLVGLDVVRRYVALMFLAVPQSIFHSAVLPSSILTPRVVLNVLWMVALAVLAWRSHLRAPLLAFGTLWFVLMLLPSVTMLVVDVGEPMAEQRAYLAGAGFAIATGAAFASVWTWPTANRQRIRGVAVAAFGLVVVVFASRTVARNDVWSDPVRLWREAVANAPDIWLPHRGLGDALRDKGDFAGAAAAYGEAARLRPQEANTQLALGVSLLMIGRADEADRALAEATRLAPGLEQAETARAMIARAAGRRDEARDRFLAVARAHPNAVLARQYLADMYENDYADFASALRMCREVQALAPQAEGVGECIRRNERRAAEAGPAAEKR
jgi:tetratricopeptide (TPR) repeat protein